MSENVDFTVEELGERTIKSPIAMSTTAGDGVANYVTDEQYVRLPSPCRRQPVTGLPIMSQMSNMSV